MEAERNILKSTETSGYLPVDIRRRVFKRDGEKCRYCKKTKDLGVCHLVPVCRGGDPYNIDNLAVCCISCIRQKGKKTDEFYRWEFALTKSSDDIFRHSTWKTKVCFLDGEVLDGEILKLPSLTDTLLKVVVKEKPIFVAISSTKKIIPYEEIIQKRDKKK